MAERTDSQRPAGEKADTTLRADDPRDAAKLRTEQLRTQREERGGDDDEVDNFALPAGMAPDGWTYEWKMLSVTGKEFPAYSMKTADAGWTPVPVARHPEWMPHGYKGKTIEREGMILMEIPTEFYGDLRRKEHKKAMAQVGARENALQEAKDGDFKRKGPDGRSLVRLDRARESIPIE